MKNVIYDVERPPPQEPTVTLRLTCRQLGAIGKAVELALRQAEAAEGVVVHMWLPSPEGRTALILNLDAAQDALKEAMTTAGTTPPSALGDRWDPGLHPSVPFAAVARGTS